eukprot:SAG31_NODE_35134_length_326_cov_0.603524_1_plen_34_part_10
MRCPAVNEKELPAGTPCPLGCAQVWLPLFEDCEK